MHENKEIIFIVSKKEFELTEYFTKELYNYNLQFYESINQAYYSVYVSPPSLILVDLRYEIFGETDTDNKITDLNAVRINRIENKNTQNKDNGKNINNNNQYNKLSDYSIAAEPMVSASASSSFSDKNCSSTASKKDCYAVYHDIYSMTDNIQKDNIISNIPLVFILPRNFNFKNIIDLDCCSMKDYVKEPLLKNELLYKVKISLLFSRTQLDANPLTKLPGNSSIINEVKKRITNNINCSFAYIDIDNFKSYNDKYGFLSGDEIIMLTSRLIASTAYDISKNRKRHGREVFVGHIGGDDFVAISHPEDIVEICSNIISNFDKIIPSFYDETDKSNGYIETYDRSNVLRQIPLMSLSVAIIPDINKRVSHYGEISEITSALKSKAKNSPGSKIVIDKRGKK
ncbi:MAG: GGDEF domain-containing protein [Candidatus Acididesulfobacter guangdongensis]|uniref:GGDEF domain-containing protein n=1 Tax=Acididesulfobacter guangdongensis TaxID=2597225 RepID=A0A519BFY9_ACIG2|nr:MAG: GGDEF domain-containing protein [Candidatus Acididesulfobacter guangdongensis]